MKKSSIIVVVIICIFVLIGYSKKASEPMLTLVHNGYTNTTILAEYKEDDSEKNYNQDDFGNSYLDIKQGEKLEYKLLNRKGKCTLLIEKADSKETVKEIVLDNQKVDTSIPKGKYIYNFLIELENGSAKFIKLIEIK